MTESISIPMEPIPPSTRTWIRRGGRKPKVKPKPVNLADLPPVPSPLPFNPERVTRMIFRWTRSMLEPGETLGINPSSQGIYVFFDDYLKLLDLYQALKDHPGRI